MIHRLTTILRTAARPAMLAPLVLGAVLLWAYWPALVALVHRWEIDPRYAHGYLVPAFALVLLWLRRRELPGPAVPPCWGGGLLIALGAALRLAGTYLYIDWLDAASLLVSLTGLCVLWGGWRSLRWSAPAI